VIKARSREGALGTIETAPAYTAGRLS
jgi:hypothetical protein